MNVQISVQKYECNNCGTASYDPNEYELCSKCNNVICIDCATYIFKDGMNVPICNKCIEKDYE